MNRIVKAFNYYTKGGKVLPQIRVLKGYTYDEISDNEMPGFKWQINEHGNNYSLPRPLLDERNYNKAFRNTVWFEDNEPYDILKEKAKEAFKQHWAEHFNVHDYYARLKVLESL